jgi:CRP-like cAMP-binding protein
MTAKVIRDSRICQISRDDFRQLMEHNPRFCGNILQILAAEVRAARKILSMLLSGSNKQRKAECEQWNSPNVS